MLVMDIGVGDAKPAKRAEVIDRAE